MVNEPALPIEEALAAVGDLLQVAGERVAIVIVGGATLNLLGIVQRSTSDVDVIARAFRDERGKLRLSRAEPFPESLLQAIRTVARDFGLSETWMNAEIGAQWSQGLPPWIESDITWRAFGHLDVGLVGRRTLIALKLIAAIDSKRRVHLHDLLALRPADAELEESAAWVATQDAGPEFPDAITEMVAYVRRNRS